MLALVHSMQRRRASRESELSLKVIRADFTTEVPFLTRVKATRTSFSKRCLDQNVPAMQTSLSVCCCVSAAGSEGFVHQPQHRDRQERPMAHRRGSGSLPVCALTTGSSNRSPQLLQECLQVGNSLSQQWIM